MDTSKRRSTDASLFQAGFEAGLAEGRKQALEEAAAFIETHSSDYVTGEIVKAFGLPSQSSTKLAQAIRALGDKP